MLAPKTTPAGAPPTRSATAERAAATIASARPDAGNTPPRLATGMRMAWATARATLSGSSVPAGPSVWTKPSASAGNRPRTRATSRRPPPTPAHPSARTGYGDAAFRVDRPPSRGRPRQEAGWGHDGTGKRQRASAADRRRGPRRPAGRHDAHGRGRRSGRARGHAERQRHGRGTGQGDADRHHDQAAARGGPGGPAGRRQPQPAAGHPRRLDPGAGGGPVPRPAGGARADHPAVQRERDAVRRRAAHRPGAAGRLAGRRLPRHPDGFVRPADGRPRPTGGDAPPRAARRPVVPAAPRPHRRRPVPLTALSPESIAAFG